MNDSQEEWVKRATDDDNMVVDVLLTFKTTNKSRMSTLAEEMAPPPALKLDWSVRQRRSKQVVGEKKEDSPVTPLSWSGGGGATTSGSGGSGDGFEEGSVGVVTATKGVDATRSKGSVTGDAGTIRKSRKKKTLSELRDEEYKLCEERRKMADQLEILRTTMDRHRSTNEFLKKIKFDLQSQPSSIMVANFDKPQLDAHKPKPMAESSEPMLKMPLNVPGCRGDSSAISSSKVPATKEAVFVLPDLNLPAGPDDGTCSDSVYITS